MAMAMAIAILIIFIGVMVTVQSGPLAKILLHLDVILAERQQTGQTVPVQAELPDNDVALMVAPGEDMMGQLFAH